MPISYVMSLKTTRMTAVQQAVDAGGGANGALVLYDNSSNALATVSLLKPSFSTSSDTITLLGVPLSTTASLSGTAAAAKFLNTLGSVVISGLTVSSGIGDIVVGSAALNSGEMVVVNSASIKHAS